MKAEINEKGILIVTAETSLEIWALEQWVYQNLKHLLDAEVTSVTDMIINYGELTALTYSLRDSKPIKITNYETTI